LPPPSSGTTGSTGLSRFTVATVPSEKLSASLFCWPSSTP